MRAPPPQAAGAVLVAVAAALLAACASVSPEKWKGRPIGDVIARLGPATRISSYPLGGSLYVWETRDPRPAVLATVLGADNEPQLPAVTVSRVTFLVDNTGRVKAWKRETAEGP